MKKQLFMLLIIVVISLGLGAENIAELTVTTRLFFVFAADFNRLANGFAVRDMSNSTLGANSEFSDQPFQCDAQVHFALAP